RPADREGIPAGRDTARLEAGCSDDLVWRGSQSERPFAPGIRVARGSRQPTAVHQVPPSTRSLLVGALWASIYALAPDQRNRMGGPDDRHGTARARQEDRGRGAPWRDPGVGRRVGHAPDDSDRQHLGLQIRSVRMSSASLSGIWDGEYHLL